MSVNIATGGMFQDCGGRAIGGGGAPPYRFDEEKILPRVLVKRVEVKDIDIDLLLNNIKVKLIDN